MTEQQKLHLHQLQDKRKSEAEHDKALAGQFEVWAREAERMRDEALAEDEMARDKAAHEQIVRRVTEELNRV